MPRLTLAALLAFAAAAPLHASCNIEGVREALPVREAAPAPLSVELAGAPAMPGLVPAVLAAAPDQGLALDRVLLRQRLAGCVVDEYAGYAPRTEFDNTPWRFHAGGDGKKFDADEFDAWMKKRGVRIARGKAAAEPTEPEPAAAPTAVAE
jgi:hypothetical protein